MPRFDFVCTACAHTFEAQLLFGSTLLPPCPLCGGASQKQIALPAIHFKGGGFYKTDSAAPAKKEEKSVPPKEEKPAKKEETKPKKKD